MYQPPYGSPFVDAQAAYAGMSPINQMVLQQLLMKMSNPLNTAAIQRDLYVTYLIEFDRLVEQLREVMTVTLGGDVINWLNDCTKRAVGVEPFRLAYLIGNMRLWAVKGVNRPAAVEVRFNENMLLTITTAVDAGVTLLWSEDRTVLPQNMSTTYPGVFREVSGLQQLKIFGQAFGESAPEPETPKVDPAAELKAEVERLETMVKWLDLFACTEDKIPDPAITAYLQRTYVGSELASRRVYASEILRLQNQPLDQPLDQLLVRLIRRLLTNGERVHESASRPMSWFQLYVTMMVYVEKLPEDEATLRANEYAVIASYGQETDEIPQPLFRKLCETYVGFLG